MSQRQPESKSDDGLLTLALIPVLLFILWYGLKTQIIFASCQILYWIYKITPDALVPGSRSDKMNLINQMAIHRNDVSLTDFITLLNLTASVAFPIILLLSVLFAYLIIKSPFYKLTRRISIKDLPRIMVKYAPANAHVLARFGSFDKLLLNENPDEAKGPLSPVEFAEKYSLVDVPRRRLMKKKAHRVFMEQVKVSQGKVSFTDYERALLSVFSLVHFSNDRERAKQLLDALNLSCLDTKEGFPNFELANDAWEEVSESEKLAQHLKGRTSSRAILHSLFDNDLMIAPAQFRWLKGLDRTLWMALSSVGRGKFFVEGAGVIAWSLSETYVLNQSSEDQDCYRTVRAAVIGLERELISFDKISVPISQIPQEKEHEYTDERTFAEKVVPNGATDSAEDADSTKDSSTRDENELMGLLSGNQSEAPTTETTQQPATPSKPSSRTQLSDDKSDPMTML